jgi:predicted XRE-type DNA-binding protein
MNAVDPIPALKEQLARELVERLDGWTQDLAASFAGTDPPRMSNLRRGQLERFSLEQLIRFVTRTRGEVTIRIAWAPHFLYRRSPAGPPRTARPGATPATRR